MALEWHEPDGSYGLSRRCVSNCTEMILCFVPSRERPLVAIRAGGRGDVTASHRVWSTDLGSDVPTPITDGTYLYVLRDNGTVYCYEALTGEEVIYGGQRAAPGTYSASPIMADGKLYLTSEDGTTTVIKAGPQFEVISQNHLNDYTHSPVVAKGQIFLRTDFALWAIGKPRE